MREEERRKKQAGEEIDRTIELRFKEYPEELFLLSELELDIFKKYVMSFRWTREYVKRLESMNKLVVNNGYIKKVH